MTEALQQEIRTLKNIFESERDPHGRVFAPLADAYRRAGELQQAVHLLSEGLAKHPDFVPGHVVAARLYVEQGLAEEGAIAARQALELDGENVSALESLLRVLDEKGDAEAEEVRAKLVALEPGFGDDTAVAASHAAETLVDVEPTPSPTAGGPLLDLPPSPEVDADSEAETLELGALDEEDTPPPLHDTAALDALTVDLEPVESPPEQKEEVGPASSFDDVAAEPVVDLDSLALVSAEDDSADPDPADTLVLADPLVPEGMPLAEEEPVMDLDSLAPVTEEEEEPVVGVEDLAPEPEMELPTEEPIVDLDSLAPTAVADEAEEPVMELADLAPAAVDEKPDVTVMDLADLAPDEAAAEEAEEPVMELADLAPDEAAAEEAEEPVMELADLAPEEPAAEDEEEDPDDIIIDMDALRPAASAGAADSHDESEAGDELPADEGLGGDEPDDADELPLIAEAEEPAGGEEPVADEAQEAVSDEEGHPGGDLEADDESPGEPIYTRTLAELYVKQGAPEKALDVLRHLQALNPDDADLERRIAELESGDASAAPAAISTDPGGDGEGEEEVDTLARELAESGEGQEEAVETPFAWDETAADEGAAEPGPSIGDYFQGLLSWKPGKRS